MMTSHVKFYTILSSRVQLKNRVICCSDVSSGTFEITTDERLRRVSKEVVEVKMSSR